MNAVFISRFLNDKLIFEYLHTEEKDFPVNEGDHVPLCDTYCKKIVDHEIPELTLNAQDNLITKSLPATDTVGIGSYLGVPIYLKNATVYGTLCCLKHEPDYSLTDRDTKLMHALAEILSETLSQKINDLDEFTIIQERTRKALTDESCLSMVYQPIFNIDKNEISMFESLSRFKFEPYQTPDLCFAAAYKVGLGAELEMLSIKKSLAALNILPSKYSLSINCSPEQVINGNLAKVLKNINLKRIVIELTEHAVIEDYNVLQAALKPLREDGLRIAVDDAGSGYASFQHIIELNADIIKLDVSLVRDIHIDRKRQALIAAIVAYSKTIDCQITAEGVETEDEYKKIKALQVDKIQGYYISRPKTPEEIKSIYC